MDEKPVFALPAQDVWVEVHDDHGILSVRHIAGEVTASLNPAQLTDLANSLLASAAAFRHRDRTTLPASLQGSTVLGADVISVSPSGNDGTAYLSVPLGPLMLTFEIPTQVLANAVGRLIAGAPPPAPPKPH